MDTSITLIEDQFEVEHLVRLLVCVLLRSSSIHPTPISSLFFLIVWGKEVGSCALHVRQPTLAAVDLLIYVSHVDFICSTAAYQRVVINEREHRKRII